MTYESYSRTWTANHLYSSRTLQPSVLLTLVFLTLWEFARMRDESESSSLFVFTECFLNCWSSGLNKDNQNINRSYCDSNDQSSDTKPYALTGCAILSAFLLNFCSIFIRIDLIRKTNTSIGPTLFYPSIPCYLAVCSNSLCYHVFIFGILLFVLQRLLLNCRLLRFN